MSITFTETITLTKIECGCCGGTYAISERFRSKKWEESGYWHCPYCDCEWGYAKGSLREELKAARLALEEKQKAVTAAKCEALAAAQAKEAAESKLSKLKHRVSCGVCPCCKRSFQNLQRHMKTQHPEAA